jgi:hypothetical protein
MRNLAAKVPEDVWPEFKVRAQAAYQAPSRAIARELAAGVVADYGRKYDSAVACFMDDFEACIAHLRFPVTHRRAIRTTNLLERLFVEERRRLKIIPNAFGERAVLKLMFGALIRAAERWRSIKVTEFEHRQITAVRTELDRSTRPKSVSKHRTVPSLQAARWTGVHWVMDERDWSHCIRGKPASNRCLAEQFKGRGTITSTSPTSRTRVAWYNEELAAITDVPNGRDLPARVAHGKPGDPAKKNHVGPSFVRYSPLMPIATELVGKYALIYRPHRQHLLLRGSSPLDVAYPSNVQ